MSDLIKRADAIEAIFKVGHEHVEEKVIPLGAVTDYSDAIKALPSADAVSREEYERLEALYDAIRIYDSSAEAVQGWIPFSRRPMTEEEQKDYPNCTFMFDCVLPDDGDEILVSNGRFVWMDAFCNDIDGCYLDSGDDIDEDIAWMPLPKPYKGGDEE